MQGFRKFALAAAVTAAMPVASFAMQSMSDSQMSGVTGQDGVTLSIDLPNSLTYNQIIYDRDGIPSNSAAQGMNPGAAGAVVMQNVAFNTSNPVTIKADVGQSTGGDPVLNLNVSFSGSTTLKTGDLYVANTSSTSGDWNYSALSGKIMDSADITFGSTTLNLQLGNVAQNMTFDGGTVNPAIVLKTSIAGGLTINNFALHDTSGTTEASSLSADEIWLVDSTSTNGPGTNLTAGGDGIGANVTANGLVLGISQLGNGYGVNEYISKLRIGDPSTSMGNLIIQGLDMGGTTVTLAGH